MIVYKFDLDVSRQIGQSWKSRGHNTKPTPSIFFPQHTAFHFATMLTFFPDFPYIEFLIPDFWYSKLWFQMWKFCRDHDVDRKTTCSSNLNKVQWQWWYRLLATRFAAYPGCRWAHLTKRSAFYVDQTSLHWIYFVENTYNRVYIWCGKYGENRYCERCANK